MSRPTPAAPTRRRARLTAVAVLVAVSAPHMLREEGLPLWVTAGFLALTGVRTLAELAGRPPLPRWLVWVLAPLVCAPLPVAFHYHLSRDLFLALLTLLVGLKVLEARSLRDWAVTVLLSQFLVLTNFLYSQSVPAAVYLVAAVWLGLVALADLADGVGTAPPAANGRLALTLLAQALPLTAVVFLLFPRIQGQLWSVPQPASLGLTGLSEELAPGTVEQVVLSDAVAFRVAFAGPPPALTGWYWRGLVLEATDGQRWWWEVAGYRDAEAEPMTADDAVAYTVTIEPHGKRWLFALDLPAVAPVGARLWPGRQVLGAPVRERRRYTAQSYLRYRTGELSGAERDKNLAVPPASDRVRQLAAGWRAGAADDAAVVGQALEHFATGGYVYTLAPAVTGPEYVEPFLFDTRQGFCEHFAGSFALLMRLAGVPSRVVVGYLGGEPNPLGEFWVVRQAQAHAWAEVWLSERGWVRVDPTAVVQPERLTGRVDNRAGSAAAVRYVGPPSDWVLRSLRHLRTLWDAAENTWDQWVLGYDVARQARLLRHLGIANPTWRHLTVGLGLVAAAILAALAALAAWQALPGGDPVQREYRRFCRRLARRGVPRLPAEAPLAYARRAAAAWPDQAKPIADLMALYLRARYGPAPLPSAPRHLRRAIRRLRLKTLRVCGTAEDSPGLWDSRIKVKDISRKDAKAQS